MAANTDQLIAALKPFAELWRVFGPYHTNPWELAMLDVCIGSITFANVAMLEEGRVRRCTTHVRWLTKSVAL